MSTKTLLASCQVFLTSSFFITGIESDSSKVTKCYLPHTEWCKHNGLAMPFPPIEQQQQRQERHPENPGEGQQQDIPAMEFGSPSPEQRHVLETQVCGGSMTTLFCVHRQVSAALHYFYFRKWALSKEGIQQIQYTLIMCPPPQKSLVKGERFIRSEGGPELIGLWQSWRFIQSTLT